MTPPPHPAPATEPLLDLHAVYLDPYNEIVQPDRVITFPRYFLDRWVALLGVSKAWLYIAFRQASYLAGRSQAISLPGSRLAQMAAMGRSTFWSILGKPELLAWFVNKAATTSRYYFDPQQGAIRQAPNAYQVLRDIPLTPADQAHLRAWLHAQSAETGAAGCRAALATAQTAPLPDLLAPAPGRPAKAEPGPLSVFDLATQAFGLTHLTAGEEKELRAASRALYQRLIPPDKNHVFVTHYFFEHWLPRLGHGSAMLATDLRDQCWEDPRKKTRRTEVLVEGGFQTLTARYGVKGYTIREWLTADAARRQCKAEHARRAARERRHSVALRPAVSAPAEAWTLKQFFSVRGRRGRDQRAPNRVDPLFTDLPLPPPPSTPRPPLPSL